MRPTSTGRILVSKAYLRFLAIIAVFALVAAGCGDSGSSPFDTATAATSPSGLGDEGGGLFSSDETIPVTVGNVPGLSDECEALLNVFLGIGSAFLGGYSGPSLDALSGLPGDLRNDAATLIDALQAYSDGLAELGIDMNDPNSFATLTEAQQQAFAELGEEIDSDEFNAAADRLSAYGEAQCADFVPGN
jgi:hypothetical protein